MKTRPDTENFGLKKDPSDFLEGVASDIPIKTGSQQPVVTVGHPAPAGKMYREQKIFRLSVDVINALKRAAFERSMATGVRVTETEMVEEAIRSYLSM